MVAGAAQAHGVFLQGPPARGGLAGVHQGRGGAGDQAHHLAGEGGDAREALEEIEGGALAGEDGGHRAGEAGQDRPGRGLGAFLHLRFKDQVRIHLTKNPGGQRQAGHHQVLLGPDVGLAPRSGGIKAWVVTSPVPISSSRARSMRRSSSGEVGKTVISQSPRSNGWCSDLRQFRFRCHPALQASASQTGWPCSNRGSGHRYNSPYRAWNREFGSVKSISYHQGTKDIKMHQAFFKAQARRLRYQLILGNRGRRSRLSPLYGGWEGGLGEGGGIFCKSSPALPPRISTPSVL